MGARGPLKLPTHLRPVSDTRIADTVAEVAEKLAPEKPAAVAEHQELSALWDQLVPVLDRAGLLSPMDGLTIELALRHVLVAREASSVVEVEGVVVKDAAIAGGMKKHPAEQVMCSESEMFLRYAQQLGMTFVSRARTPATKAADGNGEANPFAAKSVV